MGADVETHSKTLVRETVQVGRFHQVPTHGALGAWGHCGERRGGIVGVTGVKDTRRAWLFKLTKQGSRGLTETEAEITKPV